MPHWPVKLPKQRRAQLSAPRVKSPNRHPHSQLLGVRQPSAGDTVRARAPRVRHGKPAEVPVMSSRAGLPGLFKPRWLKLEASPTRATRGARRDPRLTSRGRREPQKRRLSPAGLRTTAVGECEIYRALSSVPLSAQDPRVLSAHARAFVFAPLRCQRGIPM